MAPSLRAESPRVPLVQSSVAARSSRGAVCGGEVVCLCDRVSPPPLRAASLTTASARQRPGTGSCAENCESFSDTRGDSGTRSPLATPDALTRLTKKDGSGVRVCTRF
ncbi:unnamed protein product [Pleuronectes platessa]|uniref:Uncharacterized protein n=1 Tax=Pleuronectes platessa TaxID=8262 RepID=A0A9N7YL47_PLEPL|nr:unnamed protein product [Pleuronectes platessa]